MEKQRQNWFGLAAWFQLPFILLRIRRESPADAAEELRYMELRNPRRRTSTPMLVVMARLRHRAAQPAG